MSLNLPNDPFHRYTREVILGVVEGLVLIMFITSSAVWLNYACDFFK